MTLRAWIITLRGRIREALCPDLQVLRYENELLRRHADAALSEAFSDGRYRAEQDWQQRVEPMRAEARAYKEAYFKLLETVSKVKAMEPGCPVFLATPPQGSIDARRPLTDEEIDKLPWCPSYENPMTLAEGLRYLARAIERAHGITGGNDE